MKYLLTRCAEDAKEIVQEVFLKIWEKKHQIDPHDNFEGFLFTIAKNLVYNKARRRVYDFSCQEYVSSHRSQSEYAMENKIRFDELHDWFKRYVSNCLLQDKRFLL